MNVIKLRRIFKIINLHNIFKINKNDLRTKNLNKNLLTSVIVKLLSFGLNLYLIPLTLRYVNPSEYGIWLTLSSINIFINIFDIGLGNGLRVKLTQVISENNISKAKILISTTYISLTIMLIPVTILLVLASNHINWCSLFKIDYSRSQEIKQLISILIVFFSLRIILSLISTILTSYQRTGLISVLDFISTVIISILIILFGKYQYLDIFKLGMIYSIIPNLVFILYTIMFFLKGNNNIRPSISNFDSHHLRELLELGGKYFLLQISTVIILSSGNFIIANFINTYEVTVYNLVQRYFSVLPTIYGFIVIPLVPAYADAYYKNDFSWIKNKIKLMQLMWLVLLVFVIVFIIISKEFFRLWLGPGIQIPFILTFTMGIYWLIIGWGTIYTPFINGIGKVNMQLIQSAVGVLLTLTISPILIQIFHLGAVGFVIANLITLSISTIIVSIQYYKIINSTAKGIWNK
ncbi:MAG: oligosaccharide flippase family protein [Melioribacteraceae bacterium]